MIETGFESDAHALKISSVVIGVVSNTIIWLDLAILLSLRHLWAEYCFRMSERAILVQLHRNNTHYMCKLSIH